MTESALVDAGEEAGRFTVELLRASQLQGLGCFAESDRVLGSALAAARRDEDIAVAAMGRASLRFWHLGDGPGAHAVLDEEGRRLGDRPAAEALVAQRAVFALFGGRTARALVLCRGLRRRDRAPGEARMLAAAIETATHGLRGEVRAPIGPVPPVDDGMAVVVHGGMAFAVAMAHVVNGRERPADGVDAVARVCEGSSLLLDGAALLWAGRPRSAVGVLDTAVAHLRRSDRLRTLPIALGELAYGRALLGDGDGATRAADDAVAVRHPLVRLPDFFVGRARAWAAVARGELSAARDLLASVAGACGQRGQLVFAAWAWYDVARLGDPARAATPLHRLAGGAPPDGEALVPALAAYVEALARGDAAATVEAVIRARQRGHLLDAAEAAACVAVLAGPSRRAVADRWADRARQLAGACEGARTPALARLHQLDLTSREREIVGLVARGPTNRDVADRLDLSVRTVGNHLQAVYAKLGVHRRAELSRLDPFGLEA